MNQGHQTRDSMALLRSSYLFSGLDQDLLAAVAAVLQDCNYPADTWIFKQGDAGDALFLLRRGSVEILKQAKTPGPPISLTVLEAPAAFGEIALLNGEFRTAGAQTRSETEVAILKAADFHRLMAEIPAFSLALARTMASRIVALSDQVPEPVAVPVSSLSGVQQSRSDLPATLVPGLQLQALEAALPDGWAALADPLNSRILKLNEDLEPVWQLDTSLIQVFRPMQVAWPDAGRFVLLDGDSSLLSCWNDRAQLEWELDGRDAQWRRLALLTASSSELPVKSPEALALLLLDAQGQLTLRRPNGQVLWQSTAREIPPVRDFALDQGQIWLLCAEAGLLRYDLAKGLQERIQLSGSPQWLALAPDRTLAALESSPAGLQVQLLDPGGSRRSLSLEQSEDAHFRLGEVLGVFWADASRLCVVDRYRLLQFDAQGRWQQRSLLQALPQHHNLAPVGNFVARARREAPLQGSSQLNLNDLLQRVPLLLQAPEDLLTALGRRMRTLVFNRGDLIVRQGEEGDTLFIIRQGQAQVLDDNQADVVATMGPGNLFGEVALMLGGPRNASIRAASYCELLSLQRQDLEQLLEPWPDLRQRLIVLARERQTQQHLRRELDQKRLEVRVSQDPVALSPAAGPEPDTLRTLWVRHPDKGQLARINSQGELLCLLGDDIGLMQPVAACETPAGLWVLDPGLAEVHLLDPTSLRLRQCFAQWGAISLDQPWDLVPGPDQTLWLLNAGKGQVLQLDPTGELLQVLHLGRFPTSLQVLSNGHLLLSDLRQHTVSEFTPTGQEIWRYGSPRRFGRDENLLFAPEFAQRLENGHVLIADTGNSRVIEVALDGRIVWSLIPATGLLLQRPSRCLRLANGHTLVEHSRRQAWLEVNAQLQEVWQYTVPAEGWS